MTTETISLSLSKEIISTAQKAVRSITGTRFRKSFSIGEVEDIIGNTILKATLYINRYDPSRSLFSWIYKIAENCVKDELSRKGGRFNPATSEINEIQAIDSHCISRRNESEENYQARQVKGLITDELSRMPETDRKIYSLLECGYTPKQISKVLNINSNCISVRKFRLLNNLQTKLSPLAIELGFNKSVA